MKYIAVIVVVVLLVGGASRLFDSRKQIATVIAATPTPAPVPIPTPTPIPTATHIPTPDLNRVPVRAQTVLTHAQVKEIRSDGILFLCDQGLVKVEFPDLPKVFRDYYGPLAIADTPREIVAKQSSPIPAVQRNLPPTLTDAQKRQKFEEKEAGLKAEIRKDQDIIDRWNRQTGFVNNQTLTQQVNRISQDVYDAAQADLMQSTAALAQLESDGPGF